MASMSKAIAKMEECTSIAESLGFAEDAEVTREAAIVERNLIDDCKRAGVEIPP